MTDHDRRADRHLLAKDQLSAGAGLAQILKGDERQSAQEHRLVAFPKSPDYPGNTEWSQIHGSIWLPLLSSTVVAKGLMRNNKRFQRIVIWVVVVGMVLALAAGLISITFT